MDPTTPLAHPASQNHSYQARYIYFNRYGNKVQLCERRPTLLERADGSWAPPHTPVPLPTFGDQ